MQMADGCAMPARVDVDSPETLHIIDAGHSRRGRTPPHECGGFADALSACICTTSHCLLGSWPKRAWKSAMV